MTDLAVRERYADDSRTAGQAPGARARNRAVAAVPADADADGREERRVFLFLQGIASPFFARMAREFMARGHGVRRINLCPGDTLFWPYRGAESYRGSLEAWADFLTERLVRHGVTDIVLFSDCRPYHRVAARLAHARGIEVHVFEEGYLRPHWITMERGGTNGFSPLPRDPRKIAHQARGVDSEVRERKVAGAFLNRVAWDVAYNLANIAFKPLFRGYVRHRPHNPLVEYYGWIKRLAFKGRRARRAEAAVREAFEQPEPVYLFPLQLDSDYQLREHSPFSSVADALDLVLDSFARAAPRDGVLIVKMHPLDNGLIDRPREVREKAESLGIAERVFTIDGGHLATLLRGCRGVVLVNSTVGASALHHARPVKVLGRAIYDVPGLTHQGTLDTFWSEAKAPNRELYHAFRALLVDRALVNGSFFTEAGMTLAIRTVADRIAPPLPAREREDARGRRFDRLVPAE